VSGSAYRWTFPYRHQAGRPAPLVPLTLRIQDFEVDVAALLDTGAELTLFDGRGLRAAGVDIFDGPSIPLQGFLGTSTVAYQHTIGVVIEDVEIVLPVCFTTYPIARQVLGRDLLSFFQVGLRERMLELYLSPEP